MELTFDMLQAAWNRLRTTDSYRLKKLIPGLVDPRYLYMKRIGENDDTITVMFRGFNKALENINDDVQLIKREIVNWLRKFTTVQIARGDDESFILKINKALNKQDQENPENIDNIVENKNKYMEKLTTISVIKEVHE